MNHTELDVPTADGKRYALSMRDLGSGCQLLWAPVESPGAARTARLLWRLSLKYGAPVVLKSDSGSAFIAWLTEALLRVGNVVHLLSPPRSPGYNGGAKAAMQWLKPRTERAARRDGYADALWPENFAQACMVANEMTWSEPTGGRRPIDLWQARCAITNGERRAFIDEVAANEHALRETRGGAPPARGHWPRHDVRQSAVRSSRTAFFVSGGGPLFCVDWRAKRQTSGHCYRRAADVLTSDVAAFRHHIDGTWNSDNDTRLPATL